jgi:uncharacterized protein YoxC
MGACASAGSASKGLNKNLDKHELRLAGLEYDMQTLQKNMELMQTHVELLTHDVREETKVANHAVTELQGFPLNLQQRQHVTDLQASLQKVMGILNPPGSDQDLV